MFARQPMFVHFLRYARVYHRQQHAYGHVVAPGSNSQMILFDCGGITIATDRTNLRYLRWYERLLNR